MRASAQESLSCLSALRFKSFRGPEKDREVRARGGERGRRDRQREGQICPVCYLKRPFICESPEKCFISTPAFTSSRGLVCGYFFKSVIMAVTTDGCFFFLLWGQRLSSDAPKVPERLLACKKVDVRLNDFPKKLQTMSPEQALQGCSAIARFPLCLWCTLLEESMGKRVGASFCASVFCWATFPVTPLPERLRGGNTAAGCPCPSLFSHYFHRARLLSCSLLCLAFPRPHPFLPVSVCLCFLGSERCCGTGLPPRNKAEFSILISASVPLSYFSTSLLQLFLSEFVLLLFFFIHHH